MQDAAATSSATAASTTRPDGARILLVATELARPSKAGFFMYLAHNLILFLIYLFPLHS